MDCQATSQFSVSPCDFTSITGPGWPSPVYVDASCPAQRLLPQQRQDLAIQVLAGTETVSELARQHEVSRKFLLSTGSHRRGGSQRSLRTLKSIRRRPFLPAGHQGLAAATGPGLFICQSSTRGVVELLRDLFDYRISLGTVHNSVHSAVPHARRINEQYDLSSILIGLLDEIFQAGDPVLVGVDAQSTFCFLLSPEEHRDADTWGVPAAGTGRPRLRSQGHHRRFRLGAPRRAPRGAA